MRVNTTHVPALAAVGLRGVMRGAIEFAVADAKECRTYINEACPHLEKHENLGLRFQLRPDERRVANSPRYRLKV
jgi:hypothetical protein